MVTGMRYTIVLTVNVYSYVDRLFKKINPLRMVSHHFKTQRMCLAPIICQRSAMSNPVSIVRRVKTSLWYFI